MIVRSLCYFRARGESRAINLMWPDMFYSRKGPMGVIYPGLTQLPDEIEAKFQRLPTSPFSTTAIPTELMGILPDVTGIRKSKMMVNKLSESALAYELVYSVLSNAKFIIPSRHSRSLWKP